MERRTYPSGPQKRRLYAILEADEELRAGKFSSTFSKKEAELRWNRIAQELNKIGAAVKTGKGWKKTWQDMKSKAKKKQSDLNKTACATGGGHSPPLTEEETIVLKTIKTDTISEREGSPQSVEFIDLPSRSQSPTASMGDAKFQDLTSRSPSPTASVGDAKFQDLTSRSPSPTASVGDAKFQDLTSRSPSPSASVASDVKFQDIQDILPPPEQFVDNQSPIIQNEATPAAPQKGKKKTVAKRLQESANSLERMMREKNEFKKAFYEKYIEEMQKQTKILMMIANNLKRD